MSVAVINDPVLDVGEPGCFGCPHLLEFEAADVLEQSLTVTKRDRDDVELEFIDLPRSQVLVMTLAPPPSSTSSPRAACLARSSADPSP
jgi:hypothetical protein